MGRIIPKQSQAVPLFLVNSTNILLVALSELGCIIDEC